MTRVEEKAIDAWAVYEYREHPKGLYHTCFVYGYQQGYEQAEKDLALTWEDIRKISRILDIMVDDDFKGEIPEEWGEEEYYEEVLRRFNKVKEEKK